jgi:hypothetical protein
MMFNLDFALFYAYTLCLFAFLVFWLIPQLFRAFVGSHRRLSPAPFLGAEVGASEGEPPRSPQTRLEAFTRI